MSQRVLITGANGQLGQALRRLQPPGLDLLALGSAEPDISDTAQVRARIEGFEPDLLINAAAYTQVDKAESEAAQAHAVNAEGPGNLASALSPEAMLIHVSTDFVFDGSQSRPYRPEDPTAPLGAYGQSKLAGEQAVLAARPTGSLVLRTAWVHSPWGSNFVKTMLRLMATREQLSVVDDQRGCPTSALSLASAIWELAGKPGAQGVQHWTDAGETSWHGFALEIQRQVLERGLLTREVPVLPIPSSGYPTPARRPAYSVLDRAGSEALLGRSARPWQEELARVLDILLQETPEQAG